MRKFSIFIVLLSTLFLNVFAFSAGITDQARRATTDEVKLMPGIVVTTPLSFDADMTAVIITQPADQFAIMTNNDSVEMVSFAHSRGAANGSQNVVLRTNNENQSRLQYQINKYFIASNGTPQFEESVEMITGNAISQDRTAVIMREVEIVKLWPNCNLGRLDTKVNFIDESVMPAHQLYLLNQAYLA